ncbi:MAG: hypothetical protein R2795_22710 [Saprospiraceae bacterium]
MRSGHAHARPLFADYVKQLVEEGKLSLERVEEACALILETKFRLGLFENPFVETSAIDQTVFSPAHQAIALGKCSPRRSYAQKRWLAAFSIGRQQNHVCSGPNANNMTTLGDWASPQPEDRLVTVLEGLQTVGTRYGYNVDWYDVGEYSKEITDTQIEAAASMAAQSDVCVLVLGENAFRHVWPKKTIGENIDRATL